MSEVTVIISVMGEPRTTTLADVTEFDYGHPVRFQRTEPDYRGVRLAHGVLVSMTEATFFKGVMPKPGFIVRVRLSEAASTSLGSGYEDHGPLPATHKIDILPKRGRAQPSHRSAPKAHSTTSPRSADATPPSATVDEAITRLRAHLNQQD